MVTITKGEYPVLEWLRRGRSNKEIGIALGTSIDSVREHMKRLSDKTGIGNRIALALWWLAKRESAKLADDGKHWLVP